MNAVADTSWLYALFNGNDPHHAKAKREGAQHARVNVPPAVLVETLGLIQHRSQNDERRARAALEALRVLPNLVLGEPAHDHDTAVRVWEAHEALSYVDASAIAAARRLGVGLLSFDGPQLEAHRSGRP